MDPNVIDDDHTDRQQPTGSNRPSASPVSADRDAWRDVAIAALSRQRDLLDILARLQSQESGLPLAVAPPRLPESHADMMRSLEARYGVD